MRKIKWDQWDQWRGPSFNFDLRGNYITTSAVEPSFSLFNLKIASYSADTAIKRRLPARPDTTVPRVEASKSHRMHKQMMLARLCVQTAHYISSIRSDSLPDSPRQRTADNVSFIRQSQLVSNELSYRYLTEPTNWGSFVRQIMYGKYDMYMYFTNTLINTLT